MPLTTAKTRDRVASSQRAIARKARASYWQLPTGNWQLTRPRGFTLVEMLVVMAIIVLAVTMAVPAIKFLTGTRSEESARNTLSSFIGFSRNDAIGLQQTRGVMFFLDDDDRVKCVEVMQVSAANITGAQADVTYLDVVPDRDTLSLPAGVRVWTLKDQPPPPPAVGPTFTDKFPNFRYLGFNQDFVGGSGNAKSGVAAIGGVILFGPDGRIVSKPYGFVFQSGTNLSGLGSLVAAVGGGAPPAWPLTTSDRLWSQIGCVMFDKEAFQNNANALGGTLPPDANDSAREAGSGSTPGIDTWLDQNTTPAFVNRFSGTLMQAE